MRRIRWREVFTNSVFLSPWVISFLLFSAYPLLYSLYLSFTEYNPLTGLPPQWIGLENYERMLSDQRFLQALKNTFYFVIGTIPVTTTISVLLAVILNQNIKLRSFFRASYFLPSVTSIIVISTLFVYIYAPFGPLNSILALLGVERTNWLLNTTWAMPAIMAMSVWAAFGYYTLLFLVNLVTFPMSCMKRRPLTARRRGSSFSALRCLCCGPCLRLSSSSIRSGRFKFSPKSLS